MAIERSNRPVGAAKLRRVARELLDASTLCAIATVARSGRAYVNTAYFAWTPELRIVWISEPRAYHSRNIRANATAAVAVYDSTQAWGQPDRGIQLFGSADELDGDAAHARGEIYAKRFPEYDHDLPYRCYELRPRRVKLFDERALGAGVFVTARVRRTGELTWERTEIYRRERV